MAPHEATGRTPFEVMFGRPAITRVDRAIMARTGSPAHHHTAQTWAEVNNRITRGREKSQNPNAAIRNFNEGDLVLVRDMRREDNMSPRWVGPFRVHSDSGRVTLSIKDSEGRKQVVHKNRIRAYHEREGNQDTSNNEVGREEDENTQPMTGGRLRMFPRSFDEFEMTAAGTHTLKSPLSPVGPGARACFVEVDEEGNRTAGVDQEEAANADEV